MVENSGRGLQLGRILDTNRDVDIFFGSESPKSPDLTDLGSQNVENHEKYEIPNLSGKHSYTSPAHSGSSAIPENVFSSYF